MTTTVMKDSRVGDAWIQNACLANPVQRVIDQKTGQPNGSILTGPVRLAFTDGLFQAKPKMKSDPSSKLAYQVTCLFPPYADLTIFWEEFNRIAASDFPQHWNGQYYAGLDNPIREQAEKPQFAGYTPGLKFINPSSEYKPTVCDIRMNPIVDPAKVYSGCWAIVSVNGYASGKRQIKKGPRFGLQSVMFLADDTPFAGAAPDPRTLYSGVKPVSPPAAPPANAAFGQASPQPQQLGPGAVYGQQGFAPPPPPPGVPQPPQQPYGTAPDPYAEFK